MVCQRVQEKRSDRDDSPVIKQDSPRLCGGVSLIVGIVSVFFAVYLAKGGCGRGLAQMVGGCLAVMSIPCFIFAVYHLCKREASPPIEAP